MKDDFHHLTQRIIAAGRARDAEPTEAGRAEMQRRIDELFVELKRAAEVPRESDDGE